MTAMSHTPMSHQEAAPKAPPVPRNGVDTPTLFATIGVVKDQPALAQFRFRAENRWVSGTHSQSTFTSYFGAGGTHQHKHVTTAHADHPAVLTGADEGPTPVEWLLHGLAACLTAGIANVAAARGVTLYEVSSTVEGDIDLQGILGLSKEVRNGYQGIRASFSIEGDAAPDVLEAIVRQSQARSAVFDVLTNGVPVSVSVEASAGR
jgi:uncharacterized OsmC-like protein